MMQEMEGYEVYEAYLDGHEGEIDRGEPFILEVRELETLQRKVIMARGPLLRGNPSGSAATTRSSWRPLGPSMSWRSWTRTRCSR